MALERNSLSSDEEFLQRQTSPEGNASFLSKLTFHWMTKLITKGYHQPLSAEAVWDLPTRHKVRMVSRRFHHTVNNTLCRHHAATGLKAPLLGNEQSGEQSSDSEEDCDKGDNCQRCQTECCVHGSPNTISLLLALLKTFYVQFVFSLLLGLMASCVRFANPLVLEALMTYMETKSEYTSLHGYMLVGGFLLVNTTWSLCLSQGLNYAENAGMNIKTVLINSVYSKMLKMTSDARRHYTTGVIVSLITVDCCGMETVTSQLVTLLVAPVQVGLALRMLTAKLGVSVLVGVAILLVLLLLSARLTIKSRDYRAKRLTFKDRRLKLMAEVLSGIKTIKLNAWEEPFQNRVSEVREQELHCLRMAAILDTIAQCCWLCLPVLMTTGTLLAHTLMQDNQPLSPTVVFVSLSLFNMLRVPTSILPMGISALLGGYVYLQRLAAFLSCEELSPSCVGCTTENDVAISLEDASFSWGKNKKSMLHRLSVRIGEGQLVGVVGAVGAGKSSLLCSFLGEMHKLHGSLAVTGSVAYVCQEPWIQNRSLKNCVMFDQRVDVKRYASVIRKCALRPDIDTLPEGDATEIGEKGVNLSGGQKSRLALARAVYQDADVYLLDDPLSALDSHVARVVFDKVISNTGMLKNKTRVMVTNGLNWLPMCDVILVMEQGRITQKGTYQQLVSSDGPFFKYLKTALVQDVAQHSQSLSDQTTLGGRPATVDGCVSTGSLAVCASDVRSPCSKIPALPSMKKRDKEPRTDNRRCHTNEEVIQTGTVNRHLVPLLRAFGVARATMTVIFLLLWKSAGVFADFWLSTWTTDPLVSDTGPDGSTTAEANRRISLYLGVYTLLGILQSLFVGIIYVSMISASKHLHGNMLDTIMHQPMNFYETNPTGRVLNRFSRDLEATDCTMGELLRSIARQCLTVAGVITVITYTTPVFLLAATPVLVVYYLIQKWYSRCSRQLRRYLSASRSPLLTHVSETLSGAISIRAFRVTHNFRVRLQRLLDEVNVYSYAIVVSARWFRVRLHLLGNVIVVLAALCAVLADDMSSSSAGLSLNYALQVTVSMTFLVQNVSPFESNMVCVERIVEYVTLPREAARVLVTRRPPKEWPDRGVVTFSNFSARHRPGLDLALTSINCTLHSGEKVGVVGRTGAGKSSLAMALLRVMEAAEGSVTIDGVNIATISLQDLRSRITILPQDPVVFSGTLRFNLDPQGQYQDSELWSALDRVHLSDLVRGLAGGLDHEMDEGGQNFSVGQRQLVCVARAFLRHTRVLVLDEATSGVDMKSDRVVQNALREVASDCTLLTIAHRLHTVMDCDRVMVLENGRIVEMKAPDVLLKDDNSILYNMARQAQLVS